MAEEAAAPVAVAPKDHKVEIVLSYMDDEHEKAAIEVGVHSTTFLPLSWGPSRDMLSPTHMGPLALGLL